MSWPAYEEVGAVNCENRNEVKQVVILSAARVSAASEGESKDLCIQKNGITST
jgi:hypothetical protein